MLAALPGVLAWCEEEDHSSGSLMELPRSLAPLAACIINALCHLFLHLFSAAEIL